MTELILKNNVESGKLNSIVSFLKAWDIDVEVRTRHGHRKIQALPPSSTPSFSSKWANQFSLVNDPQDERYNILLDKYDLR
jgi:hypothetical protein